MGTFCPLIKKACVEHSCKFYVHLIGNDPQTGKGIDKFDCSISFLPVLLIENAQQSRQVGAAVESFRNETVRMGPPIAAMQEIAAQESQRALLMKDI
jgi:hypothetical protein